MTTKTTVPPADAQSVADKVHSAAIHLLRALKSQERDQGISHARLSALSVLYYGGNLTISQLARAEGVRLPTMSRLVKDMAGAGLVRKKQHRGDARSSIVCISKKGRTLFGHARATRLKSISSAIGSLGKNEMETLATAAKLLEGIALKVRGSTAD